VARKDIADGDLPRLAISTALIPYSCAMDWIDWWRRRGEGKA